MEIRERVGFRAGPIPDTVLPEYDGLGLSNVVPTIERHFGLQTDIEPLAESVLPPGLLDGAERVVTLVVDALGYGQLIDAMERGHAPYLTALSQRDAASFKPLTSTFPSTTVTALTSLGTGLPPGRHGVTNQVLFDSLLGATIDILPFAPMVAGLGLEKVGIEPGSWIGLPTVYNRLAGAGVETVVVNHSQFEGTSLSLINHRGARFVGFRTISDLCVNLRSAIESAEGPAYLHSYWGTLDSVAHVYGVDSPQQTAEIRVLDHALGELLLRGLCAPRTLLLILADHGHIDTVAERYVWLNDHPELLSMLQSPPAGLDRAGVYYVLPGFEEDARQYIDGCFGDRAYAISAQESVELGLYGPQPLSTQARQRIGQLLVLPRENWVMKYQYPGRERKHWSVGKHGGLAPEEMLVPLLAVRLD